jgi:hypothetical protein
LGAAKAGCPESKSRFYLIEESEVPTSSMSWLYLPLKLAQACTGCRRDPAAGEESEILETLPIYRLVILEIIIP